MSAVRAVFDLKSGELPPSHTERGEEPVLAQGMEARFGGKTPPGPSATLALMREWTRIGKKRAEANDGWREPRVFDAEPAAQDGRGGADVRRPCVTWSDLQFDSRSVCCHRH